MSRMSDWPTRRKKTLITSAVRTAATKRSWNSSVAGSMGALRRVVEVDWSCRSRQGESTLPTSTTDQCGVATDRLVDDAEHRLVDVTVVGDDLPAVGIEGFVDVGRRRAAGFDDHETAGGEVPGLERSFPETVEAAAGDVTEVEGSGAVAAGPLRGIEEDVPDGRGLAA